MTPELKTKWLTALRSGNYKQGTGRLRDDETGEHFCCLGVLCDVLDSEAWDDDNNWNRAHYLPDNDNEFDEDDDAFLDGELDLALLEYLDFPNNAQTHLVCMNDDDEATFSQIADWIEANLWVKG